MSLSASLGNEINMYGVKDVLDAFALKEAGITLINAIPDNMVVECLNKLEVHDVSVVDAADMDFAIRITGITDIRPYAVRSAAQTMKDILVRRASRLS